MRHRIRKKVPSTLISFRAAPFCCDLVVIEILLDSVVILLYYVGRL